MMHIRIKYLIIAILCMLFLAAVGKGAAVAAVGRICPSEEIVKLNDKWVMSGEDAAGSVVCTYRIPEDLSSSLALCLKSYWCSFSVCMDGETVYSYDDIYKEKGVNSHWIELPGNAAGRELTFLFTGNGKLVRQTVSEDVYLGEQGAVFSRFLAENLYALFFGGAALLISCVILFCNLCLRFKSRAGVYAGGWHLMCFILLAGVWTVTDSNLMQIVVGKTGLVSLISFLSFMMMPVSLICFIQETMVRRRKVLDGLCLACLGNLAICILLYLFRVLPLFRMLIGIHLLIVLTLVFILKYGLEEIARYHNLEIRMIMIGFAILSVFCCLALALFYYDPSSAYSYLFSAGIVCFTACLMAAAFEKSIGYIERNASMEAYRKMAYLDALTGLGNRNDFIRDQEKGGFSERLAFLVFDLNHLKAINDRYGHQEGDRAIRDAADSIRKAFEPLGKCCRIGGDEFAVRIQDCSPERIREAVLEWEEILAQINRTREFPVEIAWGYADRGISDVTADELFARADNDMYRRKNQMKAEE